MNENDTSEHEGVLIVDDNPTNLQILAEYLETADFEIFVAEDGESALELIEYVTPDIILLDVMMPGIDGFETCHRLKNNPQTKDIPIIFMTALSDASDKVKGFEVGGVDYITKPLQYSEVLARVNTHLTIGNLQKKLQQANDELEQRVADRTHRLESIAIEKARLLTELEETVIKLKEADHLKSEFLTNMSHEMRTPLNSILGFSELLLLGINGELDPPIQDDIQLIYNSGQHLLAIVNDVLDISKIEAGLIELVLDTFDVHDIIADIQATSTILIGDKHVKIITDIPNDLSKVHADETRLKQILLNLMDNAIKFTNEGQITMKVHQSDTEPKMMLFSITDTGIGIPHDKHDVIFKRFRQADMSYRREYGGMGLGLTICQELVKMHGGNIGVISQMYKGSKFWFTIPTF
ncbi:MAG: hypothetical protein B6242_12490 [Anaerolineaceae bacterium 4572_78]|nr:MAG: hypothetical protein B6242_12490 [Anaerolineaceae bacterium 4572_78]